MTTSPTQWTDEEFFANVAVAVARFRDERLAVSDSWSENYRSARGKFDLLFQKLSDLNPEVITNHNLAEVYGNGLGEALRYLAGPPISDDDLQVLADVDSMAPGVLMENPASLRMVFDVIARVIDPHRFPWIVNGSMPTTQQKEAALLASSVLLAAQRVATERRMDVKARQEQEVKNYLNTIGYQEVPPVEINTIMNGPQGGEFCAECKLGDRKADVVLRLNDSRLMAIECKVSNSATNSVKRLNNDAAAKARHWLQIFGTMQVVPSAMLAGVFKVINLKQAQSQGLAIFWSHDLTKLGEFIESTNGHG
jgi:hypothetical protein